MKKIRFYRGMILMVLLVAVLAGCGGGGGGGKKDGTIYFALTSYYEGIEEDNPGMYKIPSGRTVKFYSSLTTGEDTFSADYVFTGTTGQGVIKATLPESLKNQKRYIYAVVDIKGSFDPRGKKSGDILKAVAEGDILAGQVEDSYGENDSVTLINGTTIGNFKLYGMPSGEAFSVIKFIIPEEYTKLDNGTSASIPEGKEVQFYVLTEENRDNFNDGTTKIEALYTFTGITGRDLSFELPDNLKSEEKRAIVAILVMNGTFDLDGMTRGDLETPFLNGDVLLGSPKDPMDGSDIPYTLNDSIDIDNFVFQGK